MKHATRNRRLSVMGAIAAVLALTACGGGGSSSSGGGGGAAGTAAACKAAPAGQKVTITYASWVTGMDKAVALWNAKNPDIQVKLNEVVGGQSGSYQNFSNQIKAGNPPDLGQIEYDVLPSFRVQDGLTNIIGCPGIKDSKAKFLDWTWSQASFGESDAVYAVPQDTGPFGLYYRKDLFQKAGIAVPTTWEEFYQAAKKIKAKGAYIANYEYQFPAWQAALTWQNHGKWFAVSNAGKWNVDLTDPKSLEVASYWQKMLDEGLVTHVPGLGEQWYKALDSGKLWTGIAAVWTTGLMQTNVKKTAGHWAVAKLPQWKAGENSAANWGGSTAVVFKGAKHPAEAAKFALWLNTAPEALTSLVKTQGIYPAAKDGANLPALSKPSPYFGGQNQFDIFKSAANAVDPNWIWGPSMTQTYADLTNGFGQAVTGKGTIDQALKTAQQKTIQTLKSQSIEVQ
jgi:multiple sugar transport system substrate-binding protein